MRLRTHRKDTDPEDLVAGISRGDTGALSRAITLVESARPEDAQAAGEVVEACLKKAIPIFWIAQVCVSAGKCDLAI